MPGEDAAHGLSDSIRMFASPGGASTVPSYVCEMLFSGGYLRTVPRQTKALGDGHGSSVGSAIAKVKTIGAKWSTQSVW